MTATTEWARAAAWNFRNCDRTYIPGFRLSPFGNELSWSDVPLLRRVDEILHITWPTNGLGHYRWSTTRGVLNGLLRGLKLTDAYRFKIDRGDDPSFWMKVQHTWRNQYLIPGTWIPLLEGELGRMAYHAERKIVTTGVKHEHEQDRT